MTRATLAERVAALEKQVGALLAASLGRAKDWRRTRGAFTGDDLMKQVFEEGCKIRALGTEACPASEPEKAAKPAMILLDTDHFSVFLDQRDRRHGSLSLRMEAATEQLACTIVSVEEVFRGWLAIIHATARGAPSASGV